MRLSLFDRRPAYEADLYAEAQSLIDDGLDVDFVLSLYPAEAEWLGPMLDLSAGVETTFAAEQPSYYFEASLKAKFLAEAREPLVAPLPAAPGLRLGSAAAGLAMASFAGLLALVTYGFVTAGHSVPGDWNYTFKLANERLQYTLSRGDDRVNVQLSQTEARVYEIQRLSSRGDISAGDIGNLQREARELADLARLQPLDDLQKARLKGILDTSTAVLSDARVKKSGLEPAVNQAINTVNEAYAAGVGGGPTIIQPAPPASPTATPPAVGH